MQKTNISWTEFTWNPTIGCSKKCDYCYARKLHNMRHKAYLAGKKLPVQYAKPFEEIQLFPNRLDDPLRKRKKCKIFVGSMADIFDPKVPFEFIDKMFAVMALCPQHTFQVLTKRPERMLEYINWQSNEPDIVGRYDRGQKIDGSGHRGKYICGFTNCKWPLPNVHLGTTCENQEMADLRIPPLLQIPAAVRFISAEPLLGDLDLLKSISKGFTYREREILKCRAEFTIEEIGRIFKVTRERVRQLLNKVKRKVGIDQVIIGAESIGGHPGRECKIEWVRNIVQQCKAAGVAVYVKQIHMWKVGTWFFETEKKAIECDILKHMQFANKIKRRKLIWPKRVLLKYPRDKDLFPKDLQCWEYPESEVKK